MGPLRGIFDQRAAERLNHHADQLGFDAISVGGTLSWLMDCLNDGLIHPHALGVDRLPKWDMAGFDMVGDSMHNAEIGVALLDQMSEPDGKIPLQFGARKFARRLAREKGKQILDRFVYNAFARQGWMVPNQYWTPGAYAPMAIVGKYYMYYGRDFLPPRELGRENARRMIQELMLDNLGICRFHWAWAEALIPDIVENIFGCGEAFLWAYVLAGIVLTAIMQSSSATIAVILTTLFSGIIDFRQGAGMVIGANVGTTVTILLGAIGGIPAKKQAAVSSLAFTVGTSLVALASLPLLDS